MKFTLVSKELHHVFQTCDVVDEVVPKSNFQLPRLVEDLRVNEDISISFRELGNVLYQVVQGQVGVDYGSDPFRQQDLSF